MIKVYAVPALKDNYVWTLVDEPSKKAVVVDPGEAAPVADFLRKHQLKVQLILLTHHHGDHTAGAAELRDLFQTNTRGPGLQDKDPINTGDFPLRFTPISIPGHTLDHTAYLSNEGHLFSGDTLFSVGCGRVFEGTMQQMYDSLQKLAALPDVTKVYCGHEYTENNLRFAHEVEPKNAAINKKLEDIRALRAKGEVTLPSTIALEKQLNPFLRCHIPEVIASAEKFAGNKLATPVEVFTAIRKWKDSF